MWPVVRVLTGILYFDTAGQICARDREQRARIAGVSDVGIRKSGERHQLISKRMRPGMNYRYRLIYCGSYRGVKNWSFHDVPFADAGNRRRGSASIAAASHAAGERR